MLLEVANLSVWYDKAMLINNLSMGVDTGELVSLVGPNGAGKSTLAKSHHRIGSLGEGADSQVNPWRSEAGGDGHV